MRPYDPTATKREAKRRFHQSVKTHQRGTKSAREEINNPTEVAKVEVKEEIIIKSETEIKVEAIKTATAYDVPNKPRYEAPEVSNMIQNIMKYQENVTRDGNRVCYF